MTGRVNWMELVRSDVIGGSPVNEDTTPVSVLWLLFKTMEFYFLWICFDCLDFFTLSFIFVLSYRYQGSEKNNPKNTYLMRGP